MKSKNVETSNVCGICATLFTSQRENGQISILHLPCRTCLANPVLGSPLDRERALPSRGRRRGPQDGAARRGPPVLTGPRDPRPSAQFSVFRISPFQRTEWTSEGGGKRVSYDCFKRKCPVRERITFHSIFWTNGGRWERLRGKPNILIQKAATKDWSEAVDFNTLTFAATLGEASAFEL